MSRTGTPPLDQQPAWQALAAHQAGLASVHLRDLFAGDPDRFRRFSLEACDLLLDYSKNRIDGDAMALLVALAREVRLEDWRERMFAGDVVNASEGRAALHVALASAATRYLDLDGSLDLARDVAGGGFVLEDGFMRTTDLPGLGVHRI